MTSKGGRMSAKSNGRLRLTAKPGGALTFQLSKLARTRYDSFGLITELQFLNTMGIKLPRYVKDMDCIKFQTKAKKPLSRIVLIRMF